MFRRPAHSLPRSLTLDLIVRRLFPTPPGPEVVADFKRHVRETGQPETWPKISTDCPPVEGEVVMLDKDIGINVKLRPGQTMAPCAICLPKGPKWKNAGSLIWCEATSAVYCIGPDCSTGEMKTKLAQARNILARTEKDKRDTARLIAAATSAPLFVRWIDDHLDLALSVSHRHNDFARSLPKFRSALSRFARTGLPGDLLGAPGAGVFVKGKAFLTGGWRLDNDLQSARARLQRLAAEASPDPATWGKALAPTARDDMLKSVDEAIKLVYRAADRMIAASVFLSDDTFGFLGRLRSHPLAPTSYTLNFTKTSAAIDHREERWRGALALEMPNPLPSDQRT